MHGKMPRKVIRMRIMYKKKDMTQDDRLKLLLLLHGLVDTTNEYLDKLEKYHKEIEKYMHIWVEDVRDKLVNFKEQLEDLTSKVLYEMYQRGELEPAKEILKYDVGEDNGS